ncbi:MAG TPA: transglycosylase domain-containing protein [Nitrosospira sp.]
MRRILKLFAYGVLVLLLVVAGVAAFLLYREVETSTYQARHLARLAGELRWEVKDGPNDDPLPSQAGPYDMRLGYSRLPDLLQHLDKHGFKVHAQAQVSERMKHLVDQGLFVPYREKTQAGLEITASDGLSLYRAAFPARIYENFEAVPSVVRDSLLFIENRELLDLDQPKKNPAVDWTRLGKAVLDKTVHLFDSGHDVSGGSTLATQIEKYRHSPNGMTLTATDKLQQVISASVRAYLEGEETLPARKRILVDYLNTVPLAAAPGFGEANGLGDGLWAWYGLDFEETNHLLNSRFVEGDALVEAASRYKHVLSLMIAQRRPSYYLLGGRKELAELTDSHLRVLTQAGVIPPGLRDAALELPLRFRDTAAPEETRNFATQKAVNAVRVRLASQLGLQRMYDLDRLDLSVQSTLDGELQKKTTEALRRLKEPDYARAVGLYGHRLLSDGDDPGKIIYSFTLSELTPAGAEFRIQADSFDQPLDINKGTKLDLGSTAKLRTLVTYLEIIEALHKKYSVLDAKALRKQDVDPSDVLSRWAIDHLLQSADKSLGTMLDAALERKYSGNSEERFFTGGGLHVFHNFKREDDRIWSVRDATLNSVNLVYIRLMRDIVRHYMFHIGGSSAKILRDVTDTHRVQYLRRFADKEGREFINRFYLKYKDGAAAPGTTAEKFFVSFRHTPRRLAAAYRYLYPEAAPAEFQKFMAPHLAGTRGITPAVLDDLYESYAPGKYSLADQGYIVTVHPLELWLVRYLINNPRAQYKDVIDASGDERMAVYQWLFKTIHKNAQDIRIRGLLELEAFLEIHRSWKRLGYPFDSLVPSLATAIGSSADHPAALAELMGIILNNGVRVPSVLVERLRFAAGTPFETAVERSPANGERLFSPELAAAVRGVLNGVVEAGTASRLARAIVEEDGQETLIGGKTGTGDHRYVTFSSPGVIKESRSVNRSATFVFFIGDRFFGTMTAFVPGADAGNYKFTSALSTQVMKHLLPILKPLIDEAKPLPEQLLAKAAVKPDRQKENERRAGS